MAGRVSARRSSLRRKLHSLSSSRPLEDAPQGIKATPRGSINSDASHTHDQACYNFTALDEEVVEVPGYFMRPESPVGDIKATPRYDRDLVGKVTETHKDLENLPVELLLRPEELKKETALRRRFYVYLAPEDLRAWIRLWDLTLDQAATILQTQRETIWRHIESGEVFLPYNLSRRLKAVRWRAREEVLLRTVHSFDEIHSNGVGYTMVLKPVPGRAYLREAYTHGLWPGDLQYFRLFAPWQHRASEDPVACAIKHLPSTLAVLVNHHTAFDRNRCIAEARLAKCIAQWAGEPDSRTDNYEKKPRAKNSKRARYKKP